jgi:transposase
MATLTSIIKREVISDSIVYSGSWKAYSVLDVSDFKHFRINHPELFSGVHTHNSGTERFWSQEERHMRKFKGIPKAQLGLYLKECEWRFNNSDPSVQLSLIWQWVKRYLR